MLIDSKYCKIRISELGQYEFHSKLITLLENVLENNFYIYNIIIVYQSTFDKNAFCHWYIYMYIYLLNK